MSVDADLATLRAVLENAIGPRRPVPPDSKSWLRRDVERINGYWDTVARVEAELSRLREQVKFCPYCAGAFVPETKGYEGPCSGCKRVEAAEARCAELEAERNEYAERLAWHREERDAYMKGNLWVKRAAEERERAERAEDELDALVDRLTDAKKLAREWEYDCRAERARCARLQQALEHISETANWYARNNARLQHEVDHCLCVEIPSIADEALAGLDTPADSQEDKT